MFYAYRSDGSEYWVSPETFQDLREKDRKRQRGYQEKRSGTEEYNQKSRERMRRRRAQKNI